jgi:hypothetical protein
MTVSYHRVNDMVKSKPHYYTHDFSCVLLKYARGTLVRAQDIHVLHRRHDLAHRSIDSSEWSFFPTGSGSGTV